MQKRQNREVFIIRRPAVWTAVILIIIISAFNIISQKRIYKKQYYLDDMFKNKSRIETIIYGEFESAVSKEKTVSIILKNVRLKFDGRTTEYKDLPSIIIYAKKSNGKEKLKLNPENKIKCNASLMELKSATNPGEFNMKAYYREKKIFYSAACDIGDIVVLDGNYNHPKKILYDFRDRLKNIYADCMPEREAGTVSAMLLGDKSMLDEEVKELYRENGMSHLLAISGVKTQNLAIPLTRKTRINSAFVPLHIAKIYILKLCSDEEIIPRCRFPCSRGYHKKYINWQKKQ